MVEPRFRGELGYVDWCIVLIEAGLCSCDSCGGHLEADVCLSCGCRQYIQEPTGVHRSRYVIRGPERGSARCADAARQHAEEEAERERQARKRVTAEELGDPQR